MKLLILAALLAVGTRIHEQDNFPTLSDQILWQSEAKVCRDYEYDCIGLGRMSTRCCKMRLNVI